MDFLKNKILDINIIFYDVEKEKTFLSKNTSNVCISFCNTLAIRNHLCGIYSSAYNLNTYFNENVLNYYPIWVAHYTNKDYPNFNKGRVVLWQFTDKGKINGINKDLTVDLNYGKLSNLIIESPYNDYYIHNFEYEEKITNNEEDNSEQENKESKEGNKEEIIEEEKLLNNSYDISLSFYF